MSDRELDCLFSTFLVYFRTAEENFIGVGNSCEFCIIGIITNIYFVCDSSVLERATRLADA